VQRTDNMENKNFSLVIFLTKVQYRCERSNRQPVSNRISLPSPTIQVCAAALVGNLIGPYLDNTFPALYTTHRFFMIFTKPATCHCLQPD
jgi:hypothetical protein